MFTPDQNYNRPAVPPLYPMDPCRPMPADPYVPMPEPYMPMPEPYMPMPEPYMPMPEPYMPMPEPYMPMPEPYMPCPMMDPIFRDCVKVCMMQCGNYPPNAF